MQDQASSHQPQTQHKPHVCMLAAENDVIPGAKVGGIGDVLRDIPAAVAKAGATVSVVIPSYGAFQELPSAQLVASSSVQFRNKLESIELYEVFPDRDEQVRYLIVHHNDLAACGKGMVYCNDSADRPFASDANKFALFCAAALQFIEEDAIGHIDVLHLHDWHTGFAAILRAFDERFQQVKHTRCVFSIHNLALQGIRPLTGDTSSLGSWYSQLQYDEHLLADPRWPNCVNPMVAGIRLSDKIHTVSPSYSLEIMQANAPERGFHGGEGLERDLQQAADRNALVGILNGIHYDGPVQSRREWHTVMSTIGDTLLHWLGDSESISAADYVAHQRTQQWLSSNRPRHVFTSVGRLTDQKMSLLLQPMSSNSADQETVLDHFLNRIKGSGVFILLGSGDSELEAKCRKSASRHSNFLFLNRYAQALSDMLFANGDVFVMPSSFEPCGISQMLAMRQGQPCIVHAVGGLKDTVEHGVDGFQFGGNSSADQAEQFLQCLQTVIDMREQQPDAFRKIVNAAREKRFYWQSSAEQYLSKLYN